MYRIPKLKERSAEFAEENEPREEPRSCDIPGCPEHGEFKAPKSKHTRNDFYWFCIDHVREYNLNWNYFEGMSKAEIERQMDSHITWDRPTWSSVISGLSADRLKQRIYEGIRMNGHGFESWGEKEEETVKRKFTSPAMPTPEHDALATMELSPPVVWEEIRAQYKKLAKTHHPDLNHQSTEAEEKFKKINLAYSILKLAYQKFEKLEKE